MVSTKTSLDSSPLRHHEQKAGQICESSFAIKMAWWYQGAVVDLRADLDLLPRNEFTTPSFTRAIQNGNLASEEGTSIRSNIPVRLSTVKQCIEDIHSLQGHASFDEIKN